MATKKKTTTKRPKLHNHEACPVYVVGYSISDEGVDEMVNTLVRGYKRALRNPEVLQLARLFSGL